LLVEDKVDLMHKLGTKQMIIELEEAVTRVPEALATWALKLSTDGTRLIYTYDPRNTSTGVSSILQAINEAGLLLKDLKTTQSSLEEIFVKLVREES
jgi:ABC-2 type transport system ATP-binding protein